MNITLRVVGDSTQLQGNYLRRQTIVCLLVAPLLLGQGLTVGKAAEPKSPNENEMLIDPQGLHKRLNDATTRILDTRSMDDYGRSHIPGAVWVDVAAWQDLGRSEGAFQNAEALGAKVGGLGIGQGAKVVVYGDRLSNAARIWWTLKYLGLEHVMLLDGGWDVWVKQHHPIDSTTPNIQPVHFVPKFQADRIEEIASLKNSVQAGTVKVVDARSTDEFTGKENRGTLGGHVPGATHLEWKELIDEDGRFKTREELRKLFRQHGILPDETAVCY